MDKRNENYNIKHLYELLNRSVVNIITKDLFLIKDE